MAPASDMFKAAAAPTAPQRPRRTAQPPAPRPAAAVAGLLLLALLAPPAAADDCYVDLAVAAGAQFCIGGSFKYLTGLISYPTTLKCGGSSPFSSGGQPAPLSGSVRVTFPAPAGGNCSFDGATLITSKNAPLAASVAAAYLNSSTPLAADTLENRFANKLLGVQVEYTASDIKLALTSSAVGGRINAKKAVAGLTVQMPAGTLNATVTASVAGQQVKQAFSFDIADAISQQGLVPGGVALAGCKLSLRTATRDWYLDCAKGKAKVPEFKVYPRANDTSSYVKVNLNLSISKMIASAPLASAQPVV